VLLESLARSCAWNASVSRLRPVPGHRQAFVIAFMKNIVERWLVEISHASVLARSFLGMPGLRHSTNAM